MTKYQHKKLIFLDTETTGLDYSNDRIIQLACMKVEDMDFHGAWIHHAQTWDQYFYTDHKISDGSFRIHGISQDMLANKPKFCDKISDFIDFIGDYTIVAHNAKFDMNFLNHEFKLAGYHAFNNPIIDSIDIAKEKYPGQSVRLDALMKRFNMPNRGHHSALEDVMILSKVYFMMTSEELDQLITENDQDDFSGYEFCKKLIYI